MIPLLGRTSSAGLGPILICVLVLIVAGSPSLAIDLPPGFVHTTILPDGMAGINAPSTIEWAPDGTLWIGQTGGPEINIWILRDGVYQKVLDLPGSSLGERGIHAIVLDPDFTQNHFLWVYYTLQADPIHNVLSRFTVVGDTPQDELVILEGPPLDDVYHNGGCLAFAQDGTLFLAMGDDTGSSTTAQDTFDLRGNLLHLQRDGSPAPGNPFPDGVGGDPRTYAWGFRNPYRCRMQPGLDNLFISDVGSFREEEISVAVPGGNFGWAYTEGNHVPGLPGFVYPIYSYEHGPVGDAIIGGDFAPAGFHPDYEGDFFFGDYARGEFYRMEVDASLNVVEVEVFATNAGRPVDFEFGPDGALYYADRTQQGISIGRIEYVGGANHQPKAVAVGMPVSGIAPLTVTLDGSGSSDPDMDPLSYAWDLGDSTMATSPVVMNTYPQGTYNAVLTVDDGNGFTDDAPPVRIISGNQSPTTTITAPVDGSFYNGGDVINYLASATDPEEGTISCTKFTSQVIFHHDIHTHPYWGPEQGSCGGTFSITTGGETSPNVWYELLMTAEDSGTPIGPEATLSHAVSVNIYPNTANLSFETLPNPNLQITWDTESYQAPITFEGVVNMSRSFGVVDDQAFDGRSWIWLNWNDGGPKEREISFPAIDTTYTATFGCDVIVEASGLNVARGPVEGEYTLTWDPVVDNCLTQTLDTYEIYASSSPVPATLPGSFPDDPLFTMVGSTSGTSFSYASAATGSYFLVVAVGTDDKPGALGHYDK